jgi:hypothetical protein
MYINNNLARVAHISNTNDYVIVEDFNFNIGTPITPLQGGVYIFSYTIVYADSIARASCLVYNIVSGRYFMGTKSKANLLKLALTFV